MGNQSQVFHGLNMGQIIIGAGAVSSGIPTSSSTNWAVQSQKLARSLKFWIQKEKGLYYPCSENKGVDQMCRYCTADLRLCFGFGKKIGFLMTWLLVFGVSNQV